jgi:hypothetical protein
MMGLSFGGEWMPVLKYSVKWCSICIVCATNCHLAWREGGESLDFFFFLQLSTIWLRFIRAAIATYATMTIVPFTSAEREATAVTRTLVATTMGFTEAY